MPTGTMNRTTGEITITYNPGAGDSLIIGGHAVIPCSTCCTPQGFDVNGPCVVAFECDGCASLREAGAVCRHCGAPLGDGHQRICGVLDPTLNERRPIVRHVTPEWCDAPDAEHQRDLARFFGEGRSPRAG